MLRLLNYIAECVNRGLTSFVPLWAILMLGCSQSTPVNEHLANTKFEMALLYDGIVSYEESVGHIPNCSTLDSDGVALTSWRFQIVPYIVDSKIQFNPAVAWDSEVNREWRGRINPLGSAGMGGHSARMFAIVDDKTGFSCHEDRQLADLPKWLWVVICFDDSTIHWMQPGDLSIEELHQLLETNRSIHGIKVGASFWALRADGIVVEIDSKVPWNVIRPFLSTDAVPSELQNTIEQYVITRYSRIGSKD